MPGPRTRLLALALVVLAGAATAVPAHAQSRRTPPSAADVSRAWIRDWTDGEETRVCSRVARPLLRQLALASGTSACSGAVASALRAATGTWAGASIVTQRAELVDDTLARVTFTLRQTLRTGSPVLADRVYLTRPDGRAGTPWRVATLGTLPFVASGTSATTLDPSTLDPPAIRSRIDEPVAPGALSPGCSGTPVTVQDPGGDVRRESPPPRDAGQLLPDHPRGNRFGVIVARRPFVAAGPRIHARTLDLRALTMSREDDGRVCLQVRFSQAPRPASRLLVRWLNPLPGSDTQGTAGAVELRFDGRGGLHLWFDRSRTTVTDPDLASRFKARVPQVGRTGNIVSVRLSAQDISNPERVRIALQSASTTSSEPTIVPVVSGVDAMGTETSGFEWPSGRVAPLFDPGAGPVN